MPISRGLTFFTALFFSAGVLAAGLDTERLSPLDEQRVDSILKKLGPAIETRKSAGTVSTLTFDELYAPLDRDEREFLGEIRSIGPERLGVTTPYLGLFEKDLDLVRLENQTVRKEGIVTALDPQYVPRKVFDRYSAMMEAMDEDLGKRLYVASGYRSPAYQMYLFLFYLVKHSYSIRETALWNAFPGYSEHGDPEHLAIDFVNEQGVDGEESVESFEALEEYRWLREHAGAFGFVLSYPKDNPAGIAFEPWHWRFAEEARAE